MIFKFALQELTTAVHRSKRTLLSRSSQVKCTLVRTYRGDAGEGMKELSDYERSLVDRARPKDEEIRNRHHELRIPKSYVSSSPDTDVADEVRRRRLIYRAKQRGWLEVDILLGTWASQNVPNLLAKELDEFESLVNEETIDIYNVLTLRKDIEPGSALDSDTVRKVMEWCKSCPLGVQAENNSGLQERYAQVKKDANLT